MLSLKRESAEQIICGCTACALVEEQQASLLNRESAKKVDDEELPHLPST
jgi:aspartate/glutamate racemase